MVIQITGPQQEALAQMVQDELGLRIARRLGAPREAPAMRGYVREAVAADVTVESEIAQLAQVLREIDRAGPRPREIQAIMADKAVSGRVKVFQVEYQWRQLRRRA